MLNSYICLLESQKTKRYSAVFDDAAIKVPKGSSVSEDQNLEEASQFSIAEQPDFLDESSNATASKANYASDAEVNDLDKSLKSTCITPKKLVKRPKRQKKLNKK